MQVEARDFDWRKPVKTGLIIAALVGATRGLAITLYALTLAVLGGAVGFANTHGTAPGPS